MGLLIECPQCKYRNSMRSPLCRCGFNIKKASGKSYWVEYYQGGKRRRERVGPSKAAADQRLREVLKARTEERFINKDLAAKAVLGQLCSWYLSLPEVKVKRSYRRDKEFIHHLLRHLGVDIKIKDLNIGKVESYQRQRLSFLG